MFKIRFSAVIAATFLLSSAVYILAAPASDVTAISQAAASNDQSPGHAIGARCSEKAWPYYESGCVRDLRQSTGRAQAVRIVSTDRLPTAPGQQVARRFIDASPFSWASPAALRFGFDG